MTQDDLIERLRKVDGNKPDYTGIQTLWNRNPDGPEAADRIEALEAVLREASLQLTYLNEKQERGTTNAVLTRIDAILSKNEEKKHG